MAGRRQLQLFRAFLALVKDPTQTDRVFVLSKVMRRQKSPMIEKVLNHLSQMEGVTELYQEGYNPPIPSLTELAKYPEGSFGRAFADHMIKNGLQIDFYPHVGGTELLPWAIERGRKSHDLWHVLLGYDTSVVDEIGLQAFGLAQIKSPFPAILVAGGILHAVTQNPSVFSEMMEKIFSGYQLGLKTKPLLGIKLEDELSTNLNDLRASLGVLGGAEVAAAIGAKMPARSEGLMYQNVQ
jgi:ubiquinone biosynthesis protein Coq4